MYTICIVYILYLGRFGSLGDDALLCLLEPLPELLLLRGRQVPELLHLGVLLPLVLSQLLGVLLLLLQDKRQDRLLRIETLRCVHFVSKTG